MEWKIKTAAGYLDHLRECLHDPEFEPIYESIREQEIPEAEDKLVDLCLRLVTARRELEVAEDKLAAFGEITIKIRTEQITLAGFVGKTIAVLRQHLLDSGRVQLPRSDFQVIFVDNNQVHADFILVEGNVIEFCMKHGVITNDGRACAFIPEERTE